MKILSVTVAVAAAAMISASAVMAQALENMDSQDPPSRVARLNLIEGQLSLQPASVDDWSPAAPNYPLTVGDHLYADQASRAEMHIGPNAIRMGSQTNLGFLNLDDRTVQIRLTSGSIIVRLRNLDRDDAWEIDTPNGAITLLDPGEYRIDTNPDLNATMVTVRAGNLEVNSNGQSFPVNERQTAYFAGDGLDQELREANAPDGFDRFSADRDRREDSLPPPRYVSREMIGYEDLESNGNWTTVPEYGPVWRPRVAVGWAPYHDGHWAWVEPWGWTWIDDAPWGFAPFHYGRWAFIGGSWGWCPGPAVIARPVYAPALVAFVGGSNWSASLRLGGGGGVAWFPLGPREVYVPGYHVSNRYVSRVNVTNVNVTNVTIINNNVNRVYVNQRVPGAVTAVSHNDFVSASPVRRAALNVPRGAFEHEHVGGMGASIAPTRASFVGTGRSAPPPRAEMINREVVVRRAPPPPPVSFAARQQVLERNQGRPLDRATLDSLRQRPDAVTSRPMVRSSSQVSAPQRGPAQPGSTGGQRDRSDRPGWQQPPQQQQQQTQPGQQPSGGWPRQGQGQPPNNGPRDRGAWPPQQQQQQQQQPPPQQPGQAQPQYRDRMSQRPPAAQPPTAQPQPGQPQTGQPQNNPPRDRGAWQQQQPPQQQQQQPPTGQPQNNPPRDRGVWQRPPQQQPQQPGQTQTDSPRQNSGSDRPQYRERINDRPPSPPPQQQQQPQQQQPPPQRERIYQPPPPRPVQPSNTPAPSVQPQARPQPQAQPQNQPQRQEQQRKRDEKPRERPKDDKNTK